MFKKINQKTAVIILLFSLFIMFFCLSFFSEATYDAGDGIRHYLVSRYSWMHHDLFLYSWGKPFFTVISSPFSQFGLLGINVFNILCALASSFFCFKIAQKLNLNYPVLVIVFLCFTPVYFPTINSGLTEPFFGLILILSVFLMFEGRFFWATLLVSFLPFVRSEGYLALPLFLAVLAYRKRVKFIPLLLFGTVFYTFVGYFYYQDILWLINQNPYKGLCRDIYGQGEFLHFINAHHFIWGAPLGVLFILGLLSAFVYFILKKKNIYSKESDQSFVFEEHFLIYGTCLAYFFAHTIFWWKGMGSSLGLIRVMAAIIPCSALICLRGFNLIMIPFLKKNKLVEWLVIIVLSFYIILNCFKYDYFPYNLDGEQAVIKEAGDWYKSSPFNRKKVYFLYPLLAHELDVDPFNPDKVGELWGLYPSIKQWGMSCIPDSTLIIWDAHFGPNEAKIPLESIMNDPNFQFVKAFQPKKRFTTLGGYPFEVYAFVKLNKPKSSETLSTFSYDFEEEPPFNKTLTITGKKNNSGTRCWWVQPETEYGFNLLDKNKSIPLETNTIKIQSYLLFENQKEINPQIVISINDDAGKNLFWKSFVIDLFPKGKEWQKVNISFSINPELNKKENQLSVYFWNVNKNNFFVDDVTISYTGKK